MTRNRMIFLGVLTIIAVGAITFFLNNKANYDANKKLTETKISKVEERPKNNIWTECDIAGELSLIQADLITLNVYSKKMIAQTIDDIAAASKRFNIPPGLLHAIIRVESDYRFWVEHPIINIKIYGRKKRVKTRAIGLGGIVWEFHKSYLQEKDIAQTKADLFIPTNNIFAIAGILRQMIDSHLEKGTVNEYNFVNKIIKSYYGAYDHSYHNKLIEITSDLWLKRISAELVNVKSMVDSTAEAVIDTTIYIKTLSPQEKGK